MEYVKLSSGTLINGDSQETLKAIKANSVDLVITDPPYLINYKTGHRKDKEHDFCSEIHNDGLEDLPVIENVIKELYRIMKDNTSIYLFTSAKTIDIFKPLIEKYFTFKNIIIWVKNNWTAGDLKAQYAQQYEMIIYAVKGRPVINGKRITDVWYCDRVSGNNQIHQNQKPVELLKQMILKSSNIGAIVLDSFSGSFSLADAYIATDRKFICGEINKEYYNNAINKYKNMDNKNNLIFLNNAC